MAKITLNDKVLEKVFLATSHLLKFPNTKMWINEEIKQIGLDFLIFYFTFNGKKNQRRKMKNKKEHINFKKVLVSIPNENRENGYAIDLTTPELTALCPFTGNPDFYKIYITYRPKEKLVELKSLKIYLFQFRNIALTHEKLLNIIFDDLIELLEPKYLKIVLDVNVRGGIKAVIQREFGGK